MTFKEKLERKRMVPLNTRVPTDLKDEAQCIADESESSLSDVVREALERCLPKLKKEVGLV